MRRYELLKGSIVKCFKSNLNLIIGFVLRRIKILLWDTLDGRVLGESTVGSRNQGLLWIVPVWKTWQLSYSP